jgi:hypothetical protein
METKEHKIYGNPWLMVPYFSLIFWTWAFFFAWGMMYYIVFVDRYFEWPLLIGVFMVFNITTICISFGITFWKDVGYIKLNDEYAEIYRTRVLPGLLPGPKFRRGDDLYYEDVRKIMEVSLPFYRGKNPGVHLYLKDGTEVILNNGIDKGGEMIEELLERCQNVEEVYLKKLLVSYPRVWQKKPDMEIITRAKARATENKKKRLEQGGEGSERLVE